MLAVSITDLKARLSHYLRAVRAGEEVRVLDRRRPVARIVPEPAEGSPIRVREARRSFPPLAIATESLVAPDDLARALAEERQSGR